MKKEQKKCPHNDCWKVKYYDCPIHGRHPTESTKTKLVRKIPIKEVILEVSLDEKSSVMIFKDHEGKEYSLKFFDSINGFHQNLDIQEL